jgi:hypothetical protein
MQLMLLRCLYQLYKHLGSFGTLIISKNENDIKLTDENNFFDSISRNFKDKCEILIIDGKKHENFSQAFASKYCLENNIKNFYNLHLDCFIKEDFISITESIKNNDTLFVGKLWNKKLENKRWYTAENFLYYINIENTYSHIDITDENIWAGKQITPTDKVDSGLGELAYYLSINSSFIKEHSFSNIVDHRGNVINTHHITTDYYTLFNDFNNYKDCMSWYAKNYGSPNFMNDLCFRQYNYLFYKILEYRKDDTNFHHIKDYKWIVNYPLLFNTPIQNELSNKR